MTAVVAALSVPCRADVVALWGALTDTERLNRALGNGQLTVKPLSDATAARYLVSTTLGGMRVEYEERPYEWVYPRAFRIVRKMRSGPLAGSTSPTPSPRARAAARSSASASPSPRASASWAPSCAS